MEAKEAKYKITFSPDQVSILVDGKTNLLEAALAAGVHINATCGGQCVCGKCKIFVEQGKTRENKNEKLTHEEYASGWRHACCTKPLSDCTILVPDESRHIGAFTQKTLGPIEPMAMGDKEQRANSLETNPQAQGRQLDPMTTKLRVQLNSPTIQDNISDLTRLANGLRQEHGVDEFRSELRCLKTLPRVLREADWKVTATLISGLAPTVPAASPASPETSSETSGYTQRLLHLIRVEAGDTTNENVALAIDIGTTTVCGQAVDLTNGRVLAEATEYNQQIQRGDDVISRIVYAQKPGGAEALQSLVVGAINKVIETLLKKASITPESVSLVVSAGNTTMTHLLLGMETRYIRQAPYVPVATFVPTTRAAEIGIELPECIPLYCFPSVSSYVGGDIVSGILGSGVFQQEEMTLYIDIGTNGEIVLGNREWLACAACSMGPAFEGAGIKHGMRADKGAIEGFHIHPATLEPMLTTVDHAKPKGICGSGLISILAELIFEGMIDQGGKFVKGLSSNRIRQGRFGQEYVIAWAQDSGNEQDIVITETDIENLIRAKAALYAGCLTLLESLALSFDQLDRVIIAGAFGRYINIDKGKQIGLLPDLPNEKFHFIGNGSMIGCSLLASTKGMLPFVNKIARMMTNVELSDNSSFMDRYMAALFLPHTDARLFPNVMHALEQNLDKIRSERKSQ